MIMFLYDEDLMTLNGAAIGFASGNTSFYQMPLNQILTVQNRSNVGQSGLWIFRTDGGNI